MNEKKILPLTGAYAAAEAMRQINPDVVAAYPITPQTPIVERFAQFVADGIVDTEMIRVESEHSAMSACVGASAAGARVMTATSSAGLALMWEVLGVASGLRLPIVMNIANRALSAPINIHCDHSDSMGARDLSWIQIYSENAQEVYEHNLLAIRLAEHKDVLLPVMVCQDGFITSHGVENVGIFPDDIVRNFVGEYEPEKFLLNINDPVTFGPLELTDYYFETKRQQEEAMDKARKIFLEIGKELSRITGREYGYFEAYETKDADVIIVVMNSTAGTAKVVVDRMRADGKKVGVLKIRLFRPFPYEEIADVLKNAKVIGVLDRSMSFGANAPIYSEIKNSLYDSERKPKLQSYIFGLGGREIYERDIEKVFEELLEGKVSNKKKYVGLRE
ncbi:MAG: pyruvate ferredoxin oxidoreductase [Candidatus Aenigmarchaeota archaeon]|nr:pyruvate ferredoxin oxidoreductase [Candidatus Aenigmarchaeota archaeon]